MEETEIVGKAFGLVRVEMRHFLDRPFLHCARISIQHEGQALELLADLAPDLALVLDGLTEGQPESAQRPTPEGGD